ncbi:MAG: 30S ribosomal protein S6 [Chloroflexi bacterium]|nr:30S ribosomal protein S6 [Chloroflexota bacterium]
MRRDYELGIILHPEVSEENTRAILDRIEQVVTSRDGQIVKVNQWGRRRLAYPIEHNRDGIYTFVDMILTPETVIELERVLKVSELVLRHMVKRRDPKAAQKEREAQAAAAAAAAATPPVATAEQPAAVEDVAAPEEQTPAEEAVVETPVLSEEELNHVPPAVEETTEV